jgi:integrase/recombinase XerD
LNLKIGDAEFDEYGAVVRVNGKTGERRLRMVESVPDLKLWLSMHPERNNPEVALFPKHRRGEGSLGLAGLTVLLENLRREAGINKHIHPHLLRHTRATHLASVLTEAQMRVFFGWSKRSRMPEIYVHLSGRDVDSTLLKHYGVKVDMPKEDILGPKACPWCKTVNSPSARFCQSCNAPLDPASADKAMKKQRRKEEVFNRWLNLVLQGDTPENATREMRREIEELATE